jgi:hypothetical protein
MGTTGTLPPGRRKGRILIALQTPPAVETDPRFGWPDAEFAVPFRSLLDVGANRAAADSAEIARLTSMVRTGRELAHSVNNLLPLPLGVLELLEAHAGVPADMQSLVAAAREALASAATQAQDYHALARQAPPFRDTLPN